MATVLCISIGVILFLRNFAWTRTTGDAATELSTIGNNNQSHQHTSK